MSDKRASEVALAVVRLMQLGPEDQASMLEVISDYFTSPSQESDETLDSDSDDIPDVVEDMPVSPDVDEGMPVTIGMHTEGKINYYEIIITRSIINSE